jgi:hypothetical protein
MMLAGRKGSRLAFLCIALLLAGCSTLSGSSPEDSRLYIERYELIDPTPSGFSVCYGYGCVQRSEVAFTDAEWNEIRAIFNRSTSAAGERELIAHAIGRIEQIVGPKAGTAGDAGGTFPGFVGQGSGAQQDCQDETANTTTYLLMLQDAGLLQHHRVSSPVGRAWLGYGGWPHFTAVVQDTESERFWAVDSWWEDNGHDAYVVPLPVWSDGWLPADGMAWAES